jgi:hypothetical protein
MRGLGERKMESKRNRESKRKMESKRNRESKRNGGEKMGLVSTAFLVPSVATLRTYLRSA